MDVAENLHRWVADIQLWKGKPDNEEAQRLVKLNALLEGDAHLSRFNETLLEERLNELEEIGCVRDADAAYGLTLARINELALLCAGNYADHGEVQGVGDLLFNPRRIRVHIKGVPGPVVKERHMALTEQFADMAATRAGVVAWLRDETVLEIEEQALLPHLYHRLRDSRVVSREYLDSVNERMTKVADLTSFFASGHFPDGFGLRQWLEHAGPDDREFVESKLCRFDTRLFVELGKAFERSLQLKDIQPAFSVTMDTVPATN